MSEFTEDLYLEIMLLEDSSYDNKVIEESYNKAFTV